MGNNFFEKVFWACPFGSGFPFQLAYRQAGLFLPRKRAKKGFPWNKIPLIAGILHAFTQFVKTLS